jgi:hypothetical protein
MNMHTFVQSLDFYELESLAQVVAENAFSLREFYGAALDEGEKALLNIPSGEVDGETVSHNRVCAIRRCKERTGTTFEAARDMVDGYLKTEKIFSKFRR